MSLKEDERFAFIPPGQSTVWGVTIFRKGEYREPTLAELDELRARYEREPNTEKIIYALKVALGDALGMLRAYASVYGPDEETDAEIRKLAGMIK